MKQLLKEAFMTKQEKELLDDIIDTLYNDGHGNRHASYAKVLESGDFGLTIVPIEDDPEMTAAIDIENQQIYVSSGFVVDKDADPDKYDLYMQQLSLLLRHELAHALLQHNIRLLHEYKQQYKDQDIAQRISMSNSLHHIMNIIEDFEISNRVYTTADKKLAVNLLLTNGDTIHGLVTEEHRQDWAKPGISVIDMYHKLCKEVDKIEEESKNYIKKHSATASASTALGHAYYKSEADANKKENRDSFDQDFITRSAKGTHTRYIDTSSLSTITMPIDEFMKTTTFYKYPKKLRDELMNLNDLIKAGNVFTKQDLAKSMDDLAISGITNSFSLCSPTTGEVIVTVYTPEEKYILMQILKVYVGKADINTLYERMYKKAQSILAQGLIAGKYSLSDLQTILDEVK